MILLRILKESVLFALHALVNNKLRTILSLLGVTIGIFAIISVLSAVDSLETNVRGEVSDLGDDVVYIQKWPWGGGNDMPWWKMMNRPQPTLNEFKKLSTRFNKAEAVAMNVFPRQQTIKYKTNSISDVQTVGVSNDYELFGNVDVVDGRFFSFSEYNAGSNSVVLGYDIAQGLFEGLDPLGKSFRLFGRKVKVIGVLAKEGDSMIGNSNDQNVLIPLNFVRKIQNLNEGRVDALIMVKPIQGVGIEQLKDELTGELRSIRRLRPRQDDNFALNEVSVLASNLDEFFGFLNIAGIIIGGFSILVGGFGIANIMFVSVRERTNIIGIQKSLGAKNYFILSQFLVESVVLSLLGGLIGLLMVFGVMKLISNLAEMDIFLGLSNIVIGLSISVSIGLIAGIIPAWMGAKMNPVDAIRTNA